MADQVRCGSSRWRRGTARGATAECSPSQHELQHSHHAPSPPPRSCHRSQSWEGLKREARLLETSLDAKIAAYGRAPAAAPAGGAPPGAHRDEGEEAGRGAAARQQVPCERGRRARAHLPFHIVVSGLCCRCSTSAESGLGGDPDAAAARDIEEGLEKVGVCPAAAPWWRWCLWRPHRGAAAEVEGQTGAAAARCVRARSHPTPTPPPVCCCLQFLVVTERLGQLLAERPSRANAATVQVRGEACVFER
jgi:hypothetical protein